MRYVISDCTLPEDLSSALGHKRFGSLLRRAAKAEIGWSYSFYKRRLEILNAPAGLESSLSEYGRVEVFQDA